MPTKFKMVEFDDGLEANEHDRCNKTKFILFKYKNPLSNSVQSIKFKSVLTNLNTETVTQGREDAVADQKGCFIK